ncbi:hypothetical protein EJ06DRAFT_531855 [Trichodelitschia bisporula]|uniref:Uncharacterized protein n=1 Tax=Trichodelitschia bisporula TaxID=703511 RepID=A0A6G1HSC5_9PEZI|nr:hypothetical protein EJ06DRAFT_531855 [Trichodelitschia bisporula]
MMLVAGVNAEMECRPSAVPVRKLAMGAEVITTSASCGNFRQYRYEPARTAVRCRYFDLREA